MNETRSARNPLAALQAAMPSRIAEAHELCRDHRSDLAVSERCGCFYCLEIFSPNLIDDWTDGGRTALCPICGIDAVISSNRLPDLSPDFLADMHKYWF